MRTLQVEVVEEDRRRLRGRRRRVWERRVVEAWVSTRRMPLLVPSSLRTRTRSWLEALLLEAVVVVLTSRWKGTSRMEGREGTSKWLKVNSKAPPLLLLRKRRLEHFFTSFPVSRSPSSSIAPYYRTPYREFSRSSWVRKRTDEGISELTFRPSFPLLPLLPSPSLSSNPSEHRPCPLPSSFPSIDRSPGTSSSSSSESRTCQLSPLSVESPSTSSSPQAPFSTETSKSTPSKCSYDSSMCEIKL